jgi:hypothetical protein
LNFSREGHPIYKDELWTENQCSNNILSRSDHSWHVHVHVHIQMCQVSLKNIHK